MSDLFVLFRYCNLKNIYYFVSDYEILDEDKEVLENYFVLKKNVVFERYKI